jgi:lysozyme family protein
MKDNRAIAIAYLKEDEGGYAERATEPGGAVNHGISLTAFREWRNRKGRPTPTIFDLKEISDAEVMEFYGEVCDRIRFDFLPSGFDYAALDAAVNEGEGECAALLIVTKRLADIKARIHAMSDCRLAVKRLDPEWANAGAGWMARIGARVPQRAIEMLGKTPA